MIIMNIFNEDLMVNSLSISRNGNIFGIVFFEIDEVIFPEKLWNDFVVVILSWWLDELCVIFHKEKDAVILKFMDGPMFVRVSRYDDVLVDLDFFVDSDGSAALAKRIPLLQLIQCVFSAASKIYHACVESGWSVGDVDVLGVSLSRVKSLRMV